MAAIPLLRDFVVTRYINLDIGYYSRGFKDSTLPAGYTERTIYTGISLNFAQLLSDLMPENNIAYGVSSVSKYYQLPYTSFEVQNWKDRD
jgi:hypothetical protein